MLTHYLFDVPLWLLAPALVMALVLDMLFGEPPAALHPVVWIGNYLDRAGRWLQSQAKPPGGADWRGFWLGASAWNLGVALVLAVALGLQTLLIWLPSAVLLALCFKPLFAWSMLRSEVVAVEKALNPEQGGSLEAGRERLSWLVSRDVAALSEAGVRESAIESLAENLSDSVVAPLFWWVLLGLPGAALYRFANTADAMWGYRGVYRGAHLEWVGKWAARTDDVLNWLPARITGVLLLLVGGVHAVGGSQRPSQSLLARLRMLRAQAARTPSPNSGWPMAAMALALGVKLEKPGVYVLHAQGQLPVAASTRAAVVLATRTVAVAALLAVLAVLVVAAASAAPGLMADLGGGI